MSAETKQQLTILNQCDNELDELYHNYAVSCGLSDTALWLLYIICDMGDRCTQSDVCDIWFHKRQSINSALKKLEAQGYLTLEAVPDNRKSKYIVLTDMGRKLAEKVITPLVSAEIDVLETFDEQERNMFVQLTQKRISAIRQSIMNIMPDIMEK